MSLNPALVYLPTGPVPGRTDSGAITANAEALSLLAEHGRFRITGDFGRMVLGYWPDNDPESPNDKHNRTPDEGVPG